MKMKFKQLNRKFRFNRKRSYFFLFLFLLVCGVGIGYAFLSTTLSIDGAAQFNDARWDVYFNNLKTSSLSGSGIFVFIYSGSMANFIWVLIYSLYFP